jgi:hypothetical protein
VSAGATAAEQGPAGTGGSRALTIYIYTCMYMYIHDRQAFTSSSSYTKKHKPPAGGSRSRYGGGKETCESRDGEDGIG